MIGDMRRFPASSFAEMDWMRSLFDDLFSDTGIADIRSMPRDTFPMVNIGATEDTVTIYVFAPGVDPENLDINIEGNLLSLSGKREDDADGTGITWYRRERFNGEFRRTIALPEGLDGDKAQARMRNGVLELQLPKRQELQPRRIKIEAA